MQNKNKGNYSQGANMTNEDRRLIVETLSEMKELKGEMREFKEHVIGRVEKLEKKEGERSKERISVVAVLISSAALVVSIIVNFFRNGGK
jgi:L-lactate utilization protein LutB